MERPNSWTLIPIKKLFIYLFGLTLSSFGIALSLKSQLGISSWDAVFAGLSYYTPLSIGIWSVIIQGSFWAITSIINKKADFMCIIPIVIRGITLDIAKGIVATIHIESAMEYKLLLFLFGYIFVGMGIGTYVTTGYSRLPIDGLMMALCKYFSWSVFKSRFLIEVVGFIAALVARGPLGIGTIIITFTIAPFITMTQRITKKLLERKGYETWRL